MSLLFIIASCIVGVVVCVPDMCQDRNGPCTADLIPHCMSDGSIVKGCSDLRKAVCDEGKTEDKTWDPKYVCRALSFCNSTMCTLDLVPHCMNNGQIVLGCAGLKNAECNNSLKEQEGWDTSKNCLQDGFCESKVCTFDLIEHCLTNGTIVRGCVGLKKAVCKENRVENRWWNGNYVCRPTGFCDTEACTRDAIQHCMNDGTIVRGGCDLKKAECKQGKKEQRVWTPGKKCEDKRPSSSGGQTSPSSPELLSGVFLRRRPQTFGFQKFKIFSAEQQRKSQMLRSEIIGITKYNGSDPRPETPEVTFQEQIYSRTSIFITEESHKKTRTV